MPGINNNLYPPIFKKSYVPAFVGTCRVYFSISIYNSYNEINKSGVQVIIQNQKTNQSVLKKSLYPSGIKITTMGIDETVQGDEKYYIQINNNDIEDGFNFNEYYKVQIRFTSSNVKAPGTSIGIDAWLNRNLANFSEWSTVVLIKYISQPVLSLKNFNLSASSTVITTNHLSLIGTVSQSEEGDYEDYKSYRIFLYDEEGILLEDSKDKYFQNSNEIQYNCKYNFQTENDYILKIQILTRNLYLMQRVINFQVNYVPYSIFEANIYAEMDNKNACAVITLQNNILTTLGTNIVIRRSSNKDNFQYWEDMYTTLIPAQTMLNFVWKDYTVENGVWYKYSAVKRNKENFRSSSVEIQNPIFADFEDIFLTTGQQQLKIKFDPQINNYSRVVSESLTETIGSKYPFIRRNGKVNYRTFSISGTITYFMDIEQNLMHSSKQDIYGNYASLYNIYNNQHNINLFNDVVQEKVFRENVLDFLYKNNVKLYKSATQGNILVKLMNITLTPNNTLSRQIYTFNCTAYQIDEFNYENCIKYGIQEEGSFINEDNLYIKKYGQLMIPSYDKFYEETGNIIETRDSFYFGTQDILSTLIKEKYQNLQINDIQISINKITFLKIFLTSEPYLIGSLNGQPYRITSDNNDTNIICSGHIVIINGKYIIIGEDGIYELSKEDTSVTSLSFVSPYEQGVIDFEVIIEESEKNNNETIKEYSIFSKVGQMWGNFDLLKGINQTIYSDILEKYTFSSPNDGYQQQVQKIRGIRIQADPGTSFYLRENQDVRYEKHTINETGVLEFYDDNTDIRGIYFVSPEFYEVTREEKERYGLKNYQFYDTGQVITFQTIKNPKNNYVYHVIPVENKDTLIVPENQLETIEEDILYASQTIQRRVLSQIWNTVNEQVEELDSETIGLLYSSFKRYIFYNGMWYPFTDQNTIVMSNITAIIDYYCDIIRRRY